MEIGPKKKQYALEALHNLSSLAKAYSAIASGFNKLDIGVEIIDPFEKGFGPAGYEGSIGIQLYSGIDELAKMMELEPETAVFQGIENFDGIKGFIYKGIYFYGSEEKR